MYKITNVTSELILGNALLIDLLVFIGKHRINAVNAENKEEH